MARISAKQKPLLSILVLFLSITAAAQDESDTDLLLILDASNSMWGQIDSVNKIVIAREAGRCEALVRAVRIKGSQTSSLTFEITDGNRVEKSFDFSAGEVGVRVARNGKLTDAAVTLQPVAEGAGPIGGRSMT